MAHETPPELALLDPADSGWANLGLWTPGATYPEAARSLAAWVGERAGLAPGGRVADPGCGEGASLELWVREYRPSEVIGYEPNEASARRAALRVPSARVLRAPAAAVREQRELDAVVAVDAAYHFDHDRLFEAVSAALRPGGRFVWTDFVAGADIGSVGRLALRAAARFFRFGRGVPMDRVTLEGALERAGLELEVFEDLCAPVLDGFADFVDRLGPRGPGSRKLRITAAACRAPCAAFATSG